MSLALFHLGLAQRVQRPRMGAQLGAQRTDLPARSSCQVTHLGHLRFQTLTRRSSSAGSLIGSPLAW
jgi:hypothetical protein